MIYEVSNVPLLPTRRSFTAVLEDLLSLGLAEVSGRIALGTRFGQIRMI